MNKLLSSVALMGLLLAPAMAADPVVAVVDGQKITYKEVMAEKADLPDQLKTLPEDKLFPLLQNKAVDTILIKKAAMKSGIAEQPEVKEAIRKATEQFIQQAFLAEKVKDVISDEAVKTKYDEFVKGFEGQKETQVRHIVTKDKTTAMAIIKALKNGSKFEKLAKEKSQDSTAKNGGDLGFVLPGELPKALDEVVMNLKPGAYADQPVQSEFGWHVLKVDGTREAKAPAFDEIKSELRTLMTEEALAGILNDLREESKVELFDAKGKPIKEDKKAENKPADKKEAPKKK